MQRKVMISCAVTGCADTRSRNPAVPVTPAEIAGAKPDRGHARGKRIFRPGNADADHRPVCDPAMVGNALERVECRDRLPVHHPASFDRKLRATPPPCRRS
jgi:uncharacterized protein (DUF849 family)